MTHPAVTYRVSDKRIATITLCRPDRHNAFDQHMVQELTKYFKKAASDNSLRAVILEAEGKSFCAGGDLNWMKAMAEYSYEENLEDANSIAEMLSTLNNIPHPTVARVQGAAYGGGVGLVACCDIVIASVDTKFCLSEVKVGMIPATISPYVVRAIGRSSRRYFTTAEIISAERAYELGLVSEVCNVEEIQQRIDCILSTLIKNSPLAIQAAKRLTLDVADRPINKDLIDDTSRRIAQIRDSDEGREGLSAFLEKRQASWVA